MRGLEILGIDPIEFAAEMKESFAAAASVDVSSGTPQGGSKGGVKMESERESICRPNTYTRTHSYGSGRVR